MHFIVFMLRVFGTQFSPVKCSKTIFRKRAEPLAPYRRTIYGPLPEFELYKMRLVLISQASAFCSGELSPNKYNVQVGFNHAPCHG